MTTRMRGRWRTALNGSAVAPLERKRIAPGSIVDRRDLGNQLATSDDISDGNRNARRKCTLSMRMRHFWARAFRRYLRDTSRQQAAPRG